MKYGSRIKKIKAIYKETYSVVLIYDSNDEVSISLSYIFEKPIGLAREILRGDMFDQCFIENGALAWPNGLELCPDSLLKLSNKGELLSA